LKRATLVTTLLGTLLIPAVGSMADPEDRIQDNQEELQENQQELENLRERIEGRSQQASSLRAEIDRLSANITDLQMAINELDARVETLEAEIRTVQARIDRTEVRISKVRELATEQAVELYKSGGTETLDVLLNARSLTDLNERIELLGVAAQENTDELIQYGRLKVQVEADNRELLAKKRDLSATLADKSELNAQLSADRTELAARLNEVTTKLADDKRHEGDLLAESREIQQEIEQAQAEAAARAAARAEAEAAAAARASTGGSTAATTSAAPVVTTGSSSQGFIWPLNGPVTSGYGPRWGSMHTGIDIDGVTGQPIVAAKSGRVIMAGAYSGYGNAVTIDHGGGISTLYGHMSAFNTSSGSSVGQGQVIGYVGCTGSCTGDHLHFEVRVNGNPTDPMPYLP
jgi:septal ring factor EnvC (AmiA/AmiB activator)